MFLAIGKTLALGHGAAHHHPLVTLGLIGKSVHPAFARRQHHLGIGLVMQLAVHRITKRQGERGRHCVALTQKARQGGFYHKVLARHHRGVKPSVVHVAVVGQCRKVPLRHTFGQGECHHHLALAVGAQRWTEISRFGKVGAWRSRLQRLRCTASRFFLLIVACTFSRTRVVHIRGHIGLGQHHHRFVHL